MKSFGAVRLVPRTGEGVVWRVLVGEKETQTDAQVLADAIRATGAEAMVVRLDVAEPDR
jgi:hypothetical protein